MVQRIFKAVWFLSLLGTLAVFLYVYASLPADVTIKNEGEIIVFSREATFYSVLILITVVNAFVFLVSRFYTTINTAFSSWFYGLIAVVNLFINSIVGYLFVINSGERYDYSNMGTLLTIAVGFVVVWIVAWPVYVFLQRSATK
jgi:hypothetical protein